VLLQRLVPAALHGRVFAVLGSVEATALGAALLGSGILVTTVGVRALFVIAGIGTLAVTAACRSALATRSARAALRPPAPAA
jgi:hypothetical protein